ncbi:MAG: RpiB/LacA/LacB family sugar-phosphate isomerase [Lachnospiraceae bacterium]|nr:RpiB/LacA/LacB family sugar-phosphate isomerase [Lachnospiraceae bacterium]
MKIAIIQGSSQREKNKMLEECVCESVNTSKNKVINFGVFPEEIIEFSYIQTAFCISMLLESKAVDFVITGCSSGQGMMLACNSLPGVLCGYVENPADAYLFGQINDGNAISYPLGLNYGWAGEINLKSTLKALFAEPFGKGYPKEDAERKQRDTKMLKEFNGITKKSLLEILPQVDREFLASVFQKNNVYQYILEHGKDTKVVKEICKYKES